MSESKELYEGVAVGGPFDGQELESRFPKGVLVVHVPDATAWVYDREVEEIKGDDRTVTQVNTYVCRDKTPRKYDQHKALRAAESAEYDVRTLS